MNQYALAIDLGGTKIAAGLVDEGGRLTCHERLATPLEGAESIAQALVKIGRIVLERADRDNISPMAVGIGTAGVVDHMLGRVTYASENLPGWAGFPLKDRLQEAFKLPVTVENDVNAMAYGELVHGAAQDLQHALFLTIGTGIGGALILNHQLWRGVHWTAGELGYLPVDGRRGIAHRDNNLETQASGPAIAQAYQKRMNLTQLLTLQEVAARARDGDQTARQVIADGATLLGNMLAGLTGFLDVEAIIIGGGVPHIGDLWWGPLRGALHAGSLPSVRQVRVLPAGLEEHAGLIGAGALALTEAADSAVAQMGRPLQGGPN
ncbi:MAG: ROK family protein [Ardenticatenaceae bacterium]|nr:ROK family protein [Ardenticatenaceae bacterium]